MEVILFTHTRIYYIKKMKQGHKFEKIQEIFYLKTKNTFKKTYLLCKMKELYFIHYGNHENTICNNVILYINVSTSLIIK